jgi:uncharacterized protein (DUF433 family)
LFEELLWWILARGGGAVNGKMVLRAYSSEGRMTAMNWADCDLIETVPGKMGGRPVIKGTRIEPDGLVADFELGSPVEEIHQNFPTVPVETIRKVVAFAHKHQPVP